MKTTEITVGSLVRSKDWIVDEFSGEEAPPETTGIVVDIRGKGVCVVEFEQLPLPAPRTSRFDLTGQIFCLLEQLDLIG